MTKSSRVIRVFISSPSDVHQEREAARRVVARVQRLYPGIELQPVLWEELALPATASFQQTIDYLLKKKPIDIAVFIFWSRLGSPLGASITRPNGTSYRSGTEREFESMLAAYEQSEQQRPIILAYRRDDDEAFNKKLNTCTGEGLEEMLRQRRLVESFIAEQFHDVDGHNLRAYHTYHDPLGFVQRLRLHLRQAINDLLQLDRAITWPDEPYRGLQSFDVEHAPIFYGRDEETCELLQRLRDQDASGCAFVVIVGSSGSGKSSLARAGVAANLIEQAVDGLDTQWYAAPFTPSLSAKQDLFAALVHWLGKKIPGWDLDADENEAEQIAASLADDAMEAVRCGIAPAFARASNEAGRKVRLLIILDQLEELWTDRRLTASNREGFLAAIEALATSGHVAVLATLRSDFYAHAQQMPTFLRMKGERGHFDLLPPDAASIHRLITEPARRAGIEFELNEQTGRSLAEVILEDAARDPNALPLLQYTLAELYRQRDEDRYLLTFDSYRELGGVEGAIGRRADEVFSELPSNAQAALEEVLPLLVTVDIAGQQAPVRHRAPLSELTSTPARKLLSEGLVAARFLTTDRQGDVAVAAFAHEALLRRWKRVAAWITDNRERLQVRTRVEQSQKQWEKQGRDESLLLPSGLPMQEARQLLIDAPDLLGGLTRDYILASIARHDQRAKRSRVLRNAVLAVITILLVASVVLYERRRSAMAEVAVEAERRLAADRTAALQEYYSLLANTNSRRETRQRGWSWQNLDDLQKAVRSTAEGKSKRELRSSIADALGATDLREKAIYGESVVPRVVAISPSATYLAIGQFKVAVPGVNCSVVIVNLKTEEVATAALPSELILKSNSGFLPTYVQDGIRALEWSRNERWLLASTRGGEVHVIDAEKPLAPVRSWTGSDGEISDLRLNSNDDVLFAFAEKGLIRAWRLDLEAVDQATRNAPPTLVAEFDGPDHYRNGLAISPDGGAIFVSLGTTIRLNADSLTKEADFGDLRWPSLVCNGRMLAGLEGTEIVFADPQEGRRLGSIPLIDKGEEDDPIERIVFSEDGTTALVIRQSFSRKELSYAELWDLSAGERLYRLQVSNDTRPVLGPKGEILAIPRDRGVAVYQLRGLSDQGFVRTVAMQSRPIHALASAPSENGVIATASQESASDPQRVAIRTWTQSDAIEREWIWKAANRHDRIELLFHPEGDRIAVTQTSSSGGSSPARIEMWSRQSGKRFPLEANYSSQQIAFSPIANRLWVVDGTKGATTIRALDERGKEAGFNISTWGAKPLIGQTTITALAAGPRHLFAAFTSGTVLRIAASDGGLVHPPLQFGEGVTCLSVAPKHGSCVVAGTHSGRVFFRTDSPDEKAKELRPHVQTVQAAACSYSGRWIAAASSGGIVRIWIRPTSDSNDFVEVADLRHGGPIYTLAFSSDERQLAVLVRGERAVRVWKLDRLQNEFDRIGLGW